MHGRPPGIARTTCEVPESGDSCLVKLHIGCGPNRIEGWTNVDLDDQPGVDLVLDVRSGLPFREVELIFAEHFVEHLTLEEGIVFFEECRRALATDGILRISTPNLDWVWSTHYGDPRTAGADEKVRGCLEMNRAFHGWGHRFLYNLPMLEAVLRAASFAVVAPVRYGESTHVELRGLERHQLADGLLDMPSVIIIEAKGRSTGDDGTFGRRIDRYVRDAAVG